MTKTSLARWYRDPLPQADGWALHRLLGTAEPAMAAIVEPFRDIIEAGPPEPMPYTPPRSLDFDDFLAGCAYVTTGKPWRDMPRTPTTRRSPYLRDRLADMPVFRDRDRPLPMRPEARCSQATADSLPRAPTRDNGLSTFPAALSLLGGLAVYADDTIPDGVIEIDGTQITLAEMQAACEGS